MAQLKTTAPARIFTLGTLPILTLEGPDARRFSNGMFTQNVRDLGEHSGARSAMTDDRGRVLGLLDLYCTGPEGFLLVLEGVDGDWFQERYGMYIVFDDVEMTDHTGEFAVYSVQGAEAEGVVARALALPVTAQDYREQDGVRVLRRDRGGSGGWDLLVPVAQAETLLQRLSAAGGQPAELKDLTAMRVQAGRPTWPSDRSGERTFVHELGLRDQVCSFNKGCYVGQEVINRMDTMGKPTRKLLGLLLEGDDIPPTGAPVLLEGKPVGQVGSSATLGSRSAALAVLQKRAWSAGTAVTVHGDDRSWSAVVAELPFA